MSGTVTLLAIYAPPVLIGLLFYVLTRGEETVRPIRYSIAKKSSNFSGILLEPFWGEQFQLWFCFFPLLNWLALVMGITEYAVSKRITPKVMAIQHEENEWFIRELRARTETLRQKHARRLLKQFEKDFLEASRRPLDKNSLTNPPRN